MQQLAAPARGATGGFSMTPFGLSRQQPMDTSANLCATLDGTTGAEAADGAPRSLLNFASHAVPPFLWRKFFQCISSGCFILRLEMHAYLKCDLPAAFAEKMLEMLQQKVKSS